MHGLFVYTRTDGFYFGFCRCFRYWPLHLFEYFHCSFGSPLVSWPTVDFHTDKIRSGAANSVILCQPCCSVYDWGNQLGYVKDPIPSTRLTCMCYNHLYEYGISWLQDKPSCRLPLCRKLCQPVLKSQVSPQVDSSLPLAANHPGSSDLL